MKPAQSSMLGLVERLETQRAKRQQQDAETLERLARRAGLDPSTAARLAHNLRPAPRQKWTFVMLSPQQNAEVVRWLSDHSKRPHKAVRLWAILFTALRSDTGEIMLSRAELAARSGMTPRHTSEVMTELEGINAIRRVKAGRTVRYHMNSNIATHVPSAEARQEAQEADGPLLRLMAGGLGDQP